MAIGSSAESITQSFDRGERDKFLSDTIINYDQAWSLSRMDWTAASKSASRRAP